MLLIAITPPRPEPSHPARIAYLLESGWDYLHLRYPGAAEREIRAVIEALPAALRPRLTLHDCFGLTAEGLAGGVHLNRRNTEPPSGFAGRISVSTHSVREAWRLIEADQAIAYATLSPIFASISKPGYGCDSQLADELGELPSGEWRSAIVGLGGITPGRIATLRRLGLGGAAVLGALFRPGTDDDSFRLTADEFITATKTQNPI